MPLIVSRASKDYVLQVTALPSRDYGRPVPPLNPGILYCAANGIAAFGCTGFVQIAGMPINRWLVSKLTGRVPPVRNLGQSLTVLSQELSRAPVDPESADYWIQHDFDIHIVGWQWSHRRYRPVVAGLCKPPASAAFRVDYLPRYWYLDRGKPGPDGRRGYRFNITAAPDTAITRAQLQAVVRRIRDLSPDDAETVLADTIRETSRSLPEAGPHVMSILLDSPRLARARVRFLPPQAPGPPAAGPRRNGHGQVPFTMSPWLVTPDRVAAPAILSGRTEVQLGAYLVTLET